MNHRIVFLLASLLLTALSSTAAATGELTDDGRRTTYRASTEAYQFSLPGAAPFPTEDVSDVTVLGVGVEWGGFTIGCEGIGVGNITAGLESDLQYVYEYYRSNWQSLALNYLIYSNPQLYTLLTKQIDFFKQKAADLIKTCRSIREMAVAARPEEGEEQAQRETECLRDHGELGCLDGEMIQHERQEAWEEAAAAMREVVDSTGRGTGIDITGSDGSVRIGAALAAQYGLSDPAREFFNDLVPSVNIKDGEKPEPRQQKVVKLLKEKQEEYSAALDALVAKYPSGTAPTVAQWAELDQAAAEFQAMAPMAPMNRAVLFELADMKTKDPVAYQATVFRLTRLQAFAFVESIISEYTAAFLNGSVSGRTADQMSAKTVRHFDLVARLLREELDGQRRLDTYIVEQQQVLREAAGHNKDLRNEQTSQDRY